MVYDIGDLEPVRPPTKGKVHWFVGKGHMLGDIEVWPNEVLGVIVDKDGVDWEIRAPLIPAKGVLVIVKDSGEEVDSLIEPTAYIRVTSVLT